MDTQSGKKKHNKWPQRTTVLTINGRVSLLRRWWPSPADGSEAPIDRVLSRDGATVTPGVRELACRLNNDAAGFDKAADNLRRAAQVEMSGEQLQLRLVVLEEGQRVLAAQQADAVPTAFTARDCRVAKGPAKTRMYAGVDGVMVPVVTAAEKHKRREKIVAKRRVAVRQGRRQPHRGSLQDQHHTLETLWCSLESPQCRIHLRPGQPLRQQSMATLLAKLRHYKNLTTPISLGTPISGWMSNGIDLFSRSGLQSLPLWSPRLSHSG